ncbi:MAG: response regulator [Gemmatimonadetes bacterium]|nr:response regulator [Gemmatimonadota bacterium]
MTDRRRLLPVWFVPWIRGGGWLAFGAGLSILTLTILRPGYGGLAAVLVPGWSLVAVVWAAAVIRVRKGGAVRQAALAALLAVVASMGMAVGLSGVGPPPAWLRWLAIVHMPLFVLSLLLWPALRRPKQQWPYLIIDLSILAVALGLLVWNEWYRPDEPPDVEQVLTVAGQVSLLLGVNIAVVRRPRERHFASFMLLVWMSIAVFSANTGLAIMNPAENVAGAIVSIVMPTVLLLGIASAEALRVELRWPWKRTEGGSPVPWIAVLAITFFVLNLVFNQNATGVGPIVLGALGTMILLVIRQAVTARHNARLQAERAQLEADARIAALVRHTSDVILITETDLKIRFASPSATALLGQDPEDVVGRDILSLVEPDLREAIQLMVAERIAVPGQSAVANWKMPGPGGDVRRVEAVVTNLVHQPTIGGLVFTLRDQTERALLEEQLNQAQKMEAIGQLAGGVAHDFNNLLTTIMGHSEVGLEILEPGHPVRDDLEQVLKASQLAASLTRQLLAFSRKQVVEPKVINVSGTLAEVVRLLKRLIKEDVTTVLDVASDLGHVKMDPSQLEQVVLNLAVNARDAMPEGGRLTIRARRQLVERQITDAVIPVDPGEYLVIEVSDTGVGMDDATQQRIFEPFFTTKPVGRGTGLGLASVYGIVRQNSGGLVLVSQLGRGTTFTVYLPRIEAEPEQAAAAPRRRPVRGEGATILLVEDETALREIAEKVLRREGYRVLVASDGDEALMLAAGSPHPIDLVLTDVIMPGMSGSQMVAEMRKLKPISRVLYMSGYPGEDLIGRLGIDDRLLRKPFTPFVLVENIRAVFEGREAPSNP